MVFDCPWGCDEQPRGISGGPFHENAWECPKFGTSLLVALQTVAQKLPGRDP